MTVRKTLKKPLMVLSASAAVTVACAGYAKPDVPDYERWTRASFHVRRGRCTSGECTLMLRGSGGAVDVHARQRVYRPHEIPGWDSVSRTQRIVDNVAQQVIRGAGGFTDQTRITLSTSTVVDRADSSWRMRCSSLSIAEQTIAKNAEGVDEVTRSRTRTSGVDCRIVAGEDRTRPLWRFRYGIASSRDSLAVRYDSAAADGAEAVSATPPITLEALAIPQARRLTVTRDPRAVPDLLRVASRWYVNTEGDVRIAVVDLGVQTTVHLSPDASDDERRALRLIGAFLATAP